MSGYLPPGAPGPSADPSDATLVFREQTDGRKVARLPGGKVVLVDLNQVDRVRDGEAWFVRLRHRETFAIADPVERVTAAALEADGGPLTSPLAHALRNARLVDAAPHAAAEPGEAGRRVPAPPEAGPSAGEAGTA
jgi:hypothetical protein